MMNEYEKEKSTLDAKESTKYSSETIKSYIRSACSSSVGEAGGMYNDSLISRWLLDTQIALAMIAYNEMIDNHIERAKQSCKAK